MRAKRATNGPGDAYGEKLLAESGQAEQATLGCLLIDASAWERIAGIVVAEDFYRPDHQLIFGACADVIAAGKPLDLIVVSEQLQRANKLVDAGGIGYMRTLQRDTGTSVNAAAYAQEVAELAARRRLARVGMEMTAAMGNGLSAVDVAARARAAIDAIRINGAPDMTWPEPVDFLKELAAPPFTAEDVPAEIGTYAIAYARHTGFDPSPCVLTAVGAAAAALNDSYQLVADGATRWQQSARLWMLSIAHSGSGKSPIRQHMLHPLHALHAEELQHHDAEVASLRDGDPKPPRPRLVVADTTIEALSGVLRDNPRGVLVATDEFESWLGSLDQYRKGGASRDRGEWLRLFDGGPHTVERVERGSLFVQNFGASLLSGTTPSTLLKLAKHLPEDGLLQRFLVAVGRRQIDGEPVANMAQLSDAYAQTLRRLYEASPAGHDGRVIMTVEAQHAFTEWTRQQRVIQAAFDDRDASLGAHLAKMPTFALRLALTFHSARMVQEFTIAHRDPARVPVSIETMQAAFRFLDRCRQHAMVLYLSLRGGSPAFNLARAIGRTVAYLDKPMIERRDLLRHCGAFKQAGEHEQQAGIEMVTDLGWIRAAEGGYQKQHVTRFAVNPLLGQRFSQLMADERRRRAAVRDQILESAKERRAEMS